VKRLTTPKLSRVYRVLRFREFNNCTKRPKFFTRDSDFLVGGLSILWGKPARGTNGTHCRLQRNVWFVNLGKIAVVWSQLLFQISRKDSFVFGMEFLFFPLNLLKRSKVGEPLINLV
jgi:hypothetical protein